MIQKRIIYCFTLVAFIGLSACSNNSGPNIDPPATGAIIDPAVGGPTQPNQVFIDLSKESQTSVARNAWDLSFYTGTEFRVLLNNSTSTLARSIQKNDLNAVTSADTVGFGAQLNIDAIFGALFGPPPAWLGEAASWSDDPSGDLTKTAIDEVSSVANDNPVYIVNRGKNPDGSPRGWMKIRTLRNGNGYTLQYAEINASSFQELNVSKSDGIDFVAVSFETGIITTIPDRNDWDFVFTIFTDLLTVGPATSIPYAIRDYVISNRNGVEVALVDVAGEITYDNFAYGQIGNVDFSTELDAIGNGWRNVAQPGSTIETGVKEGVFYLVKDTEGNYYKLRFTRLVDAQTGERGNPQFQYDLLEE
ncbi:HmuY family protein [Roseivirga sp.]|uniref:HmuY family protein n=1 Tax=Roseivirga sp. TaxID=1964215 RepID=UPI003B8B9DF9